MNFVTGALAVTLLTLFAGGLAYSIWENTGSIAFPVIVAIVLVMCYVDFIQSLISGKNSTGG